MREAIAYHPVTTRPDGALLSMGNDAFSSTSSSSAQKKPPLKAHVSFILRPLADQEEVHDNLKDYEIQSEQDRMPITSLNDECPGWMKQLAHFIRSLLL